jgi:hypothetical protein
VSGLVLLVLWVVGYSLWRAVRRCVLLMADWEWDCAARQDDDGSISFHATFRSRVGTRIMHRVRVAFAIWHCLGGEADEDLTWRRSLLVQALYRAKAAICLLLGRHFRGEGYEFDGLRVVWWNGAMVGYYEPEWTDDNVEVGLGWRNWRVILHCAETPWSRS